jgi:phosphatidylinositol-3-phosphatase
MVLRMQSPSTRRARNLVLAAAMTLTVAACSQSSTASAAKLTLATHDACGTTTTAPSWQHVVWIVMENKSYDDIVGNSSAPFENQLAADCGLATDYHGVTHPSLPNYIAMTSGSTQGIADDGPPSAHELTSPSIFSQLDADWKSLQESMPTRCDLTNSGQYAVKHNPAAYYTNIRSACEIQDVPLTTADISARFTLVTPNLCNDMHNCAVSVGDQWLSVFIPKVLESSQYAAGNTAVFLTFDEDDRSSGNHVATFVIAPTVAGGTRSATPFTHYSLLRTTEEMLGLAPLGDAASAGSMRSAFGL